MANALGTAAHAVDTDIATLMTDIGTYLAAGGKRHIIWDILRQRLLSADKGFRAAMQKHATRPSPHETTAGTVVSMTSGATYP